MTFDDDETRWILLRYSGEVSIKSPKTKQRFTKRLSQNVRNALGTTGARYRIEREWQPGDQVTLSLPFELALKRWPQGGISMEFGPLTLSLPVAAPLKIETGDDWAEIPKEFRLSGPQQKVPGFPSYNLSPTRPWAYALALDEHSLAQRTKVTWNTPLPSRFIV